MSKSGAGAPSKADAETRFRDMTLSQKLGFVGKACLFLVTFGFAFPNIFLD